MRISDLDLYKDLLREKSGLSLTPDKSYILDSRLTPVARKWGFANLEVMTMSLRGVPAADLVRDVVEAMADTETSFFRDKQLFDELRETILPQLLKSRAGAKRIRIWCAACSTGQEPYSIAMIIREQTAKLSGWKFDILASDISAEALETAKKAEYSQFEVQRGLPIQMLVKYFGQKAERWALKSEIKSMVQFKYFNLLDPMAKLGKFDLIFCGNVLVYFDEDTKHSVARNVANLMEGGGYLFLDAQTPHGIDDALKPAGSIPGIYVRA